MSADPRSELVRDFERRYAEGSGVTVEWLHEQGRWAEACDCDYEGCQGAGMVNAFSEAEFLNFLFDTNRDAFHEQVKHSW